jgi:hypothetical protein
MDEIEVNTQNNTSASETKIDIPDNKKEYGEHRKSICQIHVSQYMDDTSTYNEEYDSDDYVVTYSYKDKSVLGWSIKENESQPDVYFKIDKIDNTNFWLERQLLSKKILLLRDHNNLCRYLF